MKKFLYIIILFNCSVQAQDLTRYFDFMRLMGEDFDEYEEVEFKWNMKSNVQVLLNEGLNYLREGQIDASIAHLDSLVKIDSSLWMVYYYRGVANQLINRFVDARRDLKKSISSAGRRCRTS